MLFIIHHTGFGGDAGPMAYQHQVANEDVPIFDIQLLLVLAARKRVNEGLKVFLFRKFRP